MRGSQATYGPYFIDSVNRVIARSCDRFWQSSFFLNSYVQSKFHAYSISKGEFPSPIEHGHFRGCSRMGGGGKKAPLPKICHTYPTMMKLGAVIPYLNKLQKIYESRGTPPEFY